MKTFKKLIDFYINSSIHVAFSVFFLVKMTYYMFSILEDYSIIYFAFFGTIAGYNFVKYDALARIKKAEIKNKLKVITAFSLVALLASGYFFLQLKINTKITGLIFFILTLLYTLPFFPNKKNARNWAGIKIYIVALCWVGVTVILPILNSEIPISKDFYIKCLQRFTLIFVLILQFEIIDLKHDDPHLKTVPQLIGIRRTKILGLILLLVFYFLEFFKSNFSEVQLIVNFILILIISLFLVFSNENRSKYYTSFWVESIPIFWWVLLLLFS